MLVARDESVKLITWTQAQYESKISFTCTQAPRQPGIIAYLKWLIYLAPSMDCSSVDHVVFFNKQVALLNHPDNQYGRTFLYKELDAWYTKFKPMKKHKGRS